MADIQLYSLDNKTKKEPVLDILGNPIRANSGDISLFDTSKTKVQKKKDVSGLEYTGQILEDIFTQPVGGVVDAAESIVNLALPKEKEIEISDIIPEGNTAIGRFIRPASQFFIPYTGAFKIAKGATLFVKNSKNLDKAIKTSSTATKTKTGTFVQGGGQTQLIKPITGLTRKEATGVGLGAGAVVDAFAFAPTDPNLADLFVQYPATKNAVTKWLSTNPDGDPTMER